MTFQIIFYIELMTFQYKNESTFMTFQINKKKSQ